MPPVMGRKDSKGSFSFSGAARSLGNTIVEGPGPGKYPLKPIFGSGNSKSMTGKGVYDIAGPNKDKPGPGDYDVKHNAIQEKAGAWSMGKEARKDAQVERLHKVSLGSAHYKPKMEITLSKAPRYRFGSAMRTPLVKKGAELEPGPGKYIQPPNRLIGGSGLSTSLKARNHVTDKSVILNPGPGSYETQTLDNNRMDKATGIALGKQPRGWLETNNRPGPGKYNVTPTIEKQGP